MEAGRIIMGAICFSVAGLGAAGETVFVRPGPCAAPQTFLLAGNAAAIVRIDGRGDRAEHGVIVYRRQQERGWASRRLLGRFDLSLDEAGPTIINSGKFCRGPQ